MLPVIDIGVVCNQGIVDRKHKPVHYKTQSFRFEEFVGNYNISNLFRLNTLGLNPYGLRNLTTALAATLTTSLDLFINLRVSVINFPGE